MTEIYLHFLFTHYRLFGNAPVLLPLLHRHHQALLQCNWQTPPAVPLIVDFDGGSLVATQAHAEATLELEAAVVVGGGQSTAAA